jgi:hypothetical protein
MVMLLKYVSNYYIMTKSDYKGHFTDKNTLQQFDMYVMDSLSSAHAIVRTSNPLDPNQSYTLGTFAYVGSQDIPFNEERVVFHRGRSDDSSNLHESIRNQPFLSISIRKRNYDQNLVDVVHKAMVRFGFPQIDVSSLEREKSLHDGTRIYHFQAE